MTARELRIYSDAPCPHESDGLPWCTDSCKHITNPGVGLRRKCALTSSYAEELCEPAIREMAAELDELRDELSCNRYTAESERIALEVKLREMAAELDALRAEGAEVRRE